MRHLTTDVCGSHKEWTFWTGLSYLLSQFATSTRLFVKVSAQIQSLLQACQPCFGASDRHHVWHSKALMVCQNSQPWSLRTTLCHPRSWIKCVRTKSNAPPKSGSRSVQLTGNSLALRLDTALSLELGRLYLGVSVAFLTLHSSCFDDAVLTEISGTREPVKMSQQFCAFPTCTEYVYRCLQ